MQRDFRVTFEGREPIVIRSAEDLGMAVFRAELALGGGLTLATVHVFNESTKRWRRTWHNPK